MREKLFIGLALLGLAFLALLFGIGLGVLAYGDPAKTPANSGVEQPGPMAVDFDWCDGFINGITMHKYVAALATEREWTFPTEEVHQKDIANCILVGQAYTAFPRGTVVNPEDE